MSEAEDKPGAMSEEQSADFAAIQAAAAGADVQPGQAVAEQPQAGPSANALGVAAMVVGVLQPLLCHTVRGLKEAPQELWEPVTESVAGLLDHYGLDRPELQGPWAKLAISVVPLAGMTMLARMNDPEPEEKKPAGALVAPDLSAPAPAKAAGSKVVTFGAAS